MRKVGFWLSIIVTAITLIWISYNLYTMYNDNKKDKVIYSIKNKVKDELGGNKDALSVILADLNNTPLKELKELDKLSGKEILIKVYS